MVCFFSSRTLEANGLFIHKQGIRGLMVLLKWEFGGLTAGFFHMGTLGSGSLFLLK